MRRWTCWPEGFCEQYFKLRRAYQQMLFFINLTDSSLVVRTVGMRSLLLARMQFHEPRPLPSASSNTTRPNTNDKTIVIADRNGPYRAEYAGEFRHYTRMFSWKEGVSNVSMGSIRSDAARRI